MRLSAKPAMTKVDGLSPLWPQNATPESSRYGDMVGIPGGTFRMGSDEHYPEEAPVHHVTVDAFWIDRAPVTNRQFREFVRATGHVTFAGRKLPLRFGRQVLAHPFRVSQQRERPDDH